MSHAIRLCLMLAAAAPAGFAAAQDTAVATEWTAAAPQPQPASGSPVLYAQPASDSAPVWVVEEPLPTMAAAEEEPEYPNVNVGGFLEADAVWSYQSPANRAAVGDAQDGFGLRRTRVILTGDVAEDVGYILSLDFGLSGRPTFTDVNVRFKGVAGIDLVRIGQFRMPIGMGALTNIPDLPFMERALPFALVPFRHIAVGARDQWAGDRGTWSLAAFRNSSDRFGNDIGDDDGYSGAGRVTFLLLDEGGTDDATEDCGCATPRRLVHVGGSFAAVNPSERRVRYASAPELASAEDSGSLLPFEVPSAIPPFVDTDVFPVQTSRLYGAELAAIFGPLWAQAETVLASVDRPDAAEAFFPSYAVQGGWIVTGESRRYAKDRGVLTRARPDSPFRFAGGGGPGAIELVARVSMLDLTDAGIQGNRLTDTSFGVNWYPNFNTRLTFNYIHAELDAETGSSSADLFGLRAFVVF